MQVLIAIVPLLLASLLGSSIVFRHQRLLTLLAAAGALWEAQWLLLTVIHRLLFPSTDLLQITSVGASILLAGWALGWRHSALPYRQSGSGRRDLAILFVLSVVVVSAVAIARVNGFHKDEWITHGFYNGDTATFISLTQRSLLTPDLLTNNPFAANGYLEYPTLLHAGVANILTLTGTGLDWLRFLPLATYLQIAITVPLFFLLWDLLYPEPTDPATRWLGVGGRSFVLLAQALLTVYILGSSWDNFVYPQSHFFLTALFLLQNALLIVAWRTQQQVRYFTFAAALVITVLLMLANAVTGTAALACMLTWLGLRAMQRSAARVERGAAIGLIGGLCALFLLAMPGDPTFGLPGFSYTAAHDLLIWTPFVALLGVGIWQGFRSHSYPATAAAVLILLSGVTFIFSSRDIVVANASRFIYHAGLVAWPLVLPPLIRVWYLWRREWRYSTRTLPEFALGCVLLITMLLGPSLLPLASIASAHDNLMRQDTQVVTTALREALWWIEDHAAPDAVIIASPHPPFAVPMFTGRAQLRTAYPDGAYWLSPDDDTLVQLRAAFAGNAEAQSSIVTAGDYLLLSATERRSWEPVPYEKVFDSNAYVIYQLR